MKFVTTDSRPEIRNIKSSELKIFFETHGEKSFRAKQLEEWLWKKCAPSFDEMTNLSISARELLKDKFSFHPAVVKEVLNSVDGTVKTIFHLFDDNLIEGVLIPSDNRTTACISTQVGCNLACRFCATGKIGLKRNLTTGEIFDQVSILMKQSENVESKRLSNIVIMGMGEPLMNYDNIISAIGKMTSEAGLGFSPQRITLSTVGIAKMIRKLADDNVKFKLAVSLHSANDKVRTSIMPFNKHNNLDKLTRAVKYFHKKTGSRVTFEYLMLKDINDSIKDAAELALFCKNFPCKINIIEYNQVDGINYMPSLATRIKKFTEYLDAKNIIVNVRKSKGSDIDAACGQLANRK